MIQVSKGGPPLKDQALREFEVELDYQLPQHYRDFLMRTNGGVPTPDHYAVYGWQESPVSDIQQFFALDDGPNSLRAVLGDVSGELPPGFLPIGHSSTNDFILLSLRPKDYGTIYFWDLWDETQVSPLARSGYGNLYFIADDFASFVRSIGRYEDVGPGQ